MKITVTFDTENDAFHQEYNEVFNVFTDLAFKAWVGKYDKPNVHAIMDTNGNACGAITVEEGKL